jgi:hypothetical protein
MTPPLRVIAFLPNLHLKASQSRSAGPFLLCSTQSPEMVGVLGSAGNETASKMVSQFETTFGEPFQPACLVASLQGKVDASHIRDFRNVCAISAVIGGMASGLQGGQFVVRHSDHFALFHYMPGQSGWMVTGDGLSKNLTDELEKFRGTSLASVGAPSHFHCHFDKPLLEQLTWAWSAFHDRRKYRRPLGRLFRSLEVAFHASAFPSDGLTTVNDAGTRLALWVSAFEILLRPKTGDVSRAVVQAALKNVSWSHKEMTTLSERCCTSHRQARSGCQSGATCTERCRFTLPLPAAPLLTSL